VENLIFINSDVFIIEKEARANLERLMALVLRFCPVTQQAAT
jgi:hypothetical protein